jgi:hypothetical protein
MKKLFLVLVLLLMATQVWAMDVKLACDPNSESDLAGYRIYWSQASGSYSTSQMQQFPLSVITPATPQFTIVNLDETKTWYFVATAYDTENLESGYSNEVSVLWDGVTGVPPGVPSGLKPMEIKVTRPDGTVVTIVIP